MRPESFSSGGDGGSAIVAADCDSVAAFDIVAGRHVHRKKKRKERKTLFNPLLSGCLYCVSLGFTGFYWVMHGFIGLCWVLLGFTGF